MAKRHLANSAT